MAQRPGTIANEFLDLAKAEGSTLTSMQIQKLVYITHGWYLAVCNEPLVDEIVQAWDYGPVFPSLYHSFKDFGSKPIDREYSTWVDSPDTEMGIKQVVPRLTNAHVNENDAVSVVWKTYRKMSAAKLSGLTHMPGTPWSKARDAYPKGTNGIPIENDDIKAHYKAKLNEAAKIG